MEGRERDDSYAPAADPGERLSIRSSWASPRDTSSSFGSSPSFSRLSSFDFGDCPPQSEYEEIPSARWLTALFGSPPVSGSATAAGSTRPDKWEERLPSDYKKILARADVPVRFSSFEDLYDQLCDSILIDSGRKSFSLDRRTGKKCFMLSARESSVTCNMGKPSIIFKFSSKSRFLEVVDIPQIPRTAFISWRMTVGELSPGTTYAAYLAYELSSRFDGHNKPLFLKAEVKVDGGQYSLKTVLLEGTTPGSGSMDGWMEKLGDFTVDVGEQPWPGRPRPKTDGWMEVELGDFFVDDGKWKEMVSIGLRFHGGRPGLVVEGIDVRPKRGRGSDGGNDVAPLKFSRRDPLSYLALWS